MVAQVLGFPQILIVGDFERTRFSPL